MKNLVNFIKFATIASVLDALYLLAFYNKAEQSISEKKTHIENSDERDRYVVNATLLFLSTGLALSATTALAMNYMVNEDTKKALKTA